MPFTDDDRDALRDWWDEDETASVESSFPIIARIVARERAETLREAAHFLRGQGSMRFTAAGPLDPRGAAFWDAGCGLDPADGDVLGAAR